MQRIVARFSGCAAVLLVALLWVVNPQFFSFLDNQIYNYRMQGLEPH